MKERRLIAYNVRKHRKALKKTQEQLAADTGLDRTFISDVERFEVDMRLSTIAKLAKALKIKVGDLFVDEI